MDGIEVNLQRLGAALSRMLDPLALAVERFVLLVRHYLDGFGLSYSTQSTVIGAVVALVALMLVRSLSGWWRLLLILALAVLLAKLYGLLPGG